MMVTFVSQCEHKALNRTRRVLDAFANRIGSRTWQTVITDEGLQAVKKLLRKSATKNTAVSCHWIRSRSRSDLVWLVGNRDKFNADGYVPVNWTQKQIVNTQYENDWKYLPVIKALTAISALFHDWGKASKLFQEKLKPNSKYKYKGDPLRHEWISCLLLNALIQQGHTETDSDWLSTLMDGNIDESQLKNNITPDTINPLDQLPMTAKLVAWLIVSHHRLPLTKDDWRNEAANDIDDILKRITQEWGYENKHDEAEYLKRVNACFEFPNGLISQSTKWLSQVKKWAKKLHACQPLIETAMQDGSFRLILHHSRLCLMLGDHFYSSQDADKKWQDTIGLYANTDRVTKSLKQKLDEHLVGVARNALNTAHLLPAFEQEPPFAEAIDSLKKRSPKGYQWQDRAVHKIIVWQQETFQADKTTYGFFAVNMASTGCGKTFANAKVMRALSPGASSLRYVLALGLRTLTLQTGDEYRERIGLDNSELAVLIGSKAVMELHQQAKLTNEEKSYENSGSESQASLLGEEIDFDCDIPEKGLTTVLTCERDRQFLYAPVLSCTIDHLMAATETKRGGRYILPTLRLMSSDLVIDEIDDFTGDDLIAIGRLIHLAGMLGRKVMISSATIPPDMAEGYFKAYRDGWQLYCKTRTASEIIGCAWIDEFNTHTISNDASTTPEAIKQYRQCHKKFIDKRVKKLDQQPAKRKVDISHCQSIIDDYQGQSHQQQEVIESKQQAYFNIIAMATLEKHSTHSFQDKQTQLKVSFGVVRVANISPCIALTEFLLAHDWPVDTEVRVMAYHSQQVLLMRSMQERHLDQVLKRKENLGEPPKSLNHPIIRQHLNAINQNNAEIKNVLFILVATPVEEVGRDHDFDWAVIEPSSYRSIVQLAGRVKRHREGEVECPNISVLQYNWKGVRDYHQDDVKVFNRPGFEELLRLSSHDMNDLIDAEVVKQRLDAVARIQKPDHLTANYLRNLTKAESLAELEHAATWHCLSNYKREGLGRQVGPDTLQGYLNESWFLTALPQVLTPFRKSEPSLKVFLVFDEDHQESKFCEKDEQGYTIDREQILNIQRIELSKQAKNRLWLTRDFDRCCEKMAGEQNLSQRIISLRYGELSFSHNEKKQYVYNDQLGLVKV